jgi:outer membrane protein OmpA-like peptidoglycan-associated protein
MKMATKTLLFTAALLAAPSLTLAAEPPIQGIIIANEGPVIVVRSGGSDVRVTVDDTTKIRGISGFMDLERTPHPPGDLIRGLAVSIKAGDEGPAAEAVMFKERDLKTAQQIGAGLYGTEQRVATNAQGVAANAAGISANAAGIATNSSRIDNVGEMVAAGRTKVYFALGSSKLTSQGEQDLQSIATQAKGMKGFRLAVVGRADPSGDVAANQRLSEARAQVVADYLLKNCGVLPGQILPLAGAGESEVAQDPDPPQTPEEGRRVTVTIAVSKSAAS